MMRPHHFLLRASQRLNSIRLPAKGAMQLLTTLLAFSLCLFPNIASAATPHIYVSPQTGSPGSQAQVLGTGFDPNATIDIYFDSTDVALAISGSNGSFGMTPPKPTPVEGALPLIKVPDDAAPGQHWVTAVERITQLQAQVPFTVSGLTDWPQFHFDVQHTGFNPYETILSPETVGNLTTRWKYTMGGQVDGSPTVANGVVYASSSNQEVNHFYALDASTGALLWKLPMWVWWRAPAAVVKGVVYVGSCESSSYLWALNADSGAVLWKYPLTCVSTSPTVVNGVVYVGSSNNIYALNADTGATLWEYITGDSVQSSPAVSNGVVYVGSRDYNLYALDAATGALLWKYATGGGVDSSPAVANGVVYVGSDDWNLYALNASTGALIWKYTTAGWLDSPAVADGVIYVGSAESYFNGNLYALDAGTGELLWKYVPGGNFDSSPAVANGVIYIGSEEPDYNSCVYAIHAGTGALLWKYSSGDYYIASSPAVVNGMLYVGSYDGNFYAFGLPKQQMAEKFSPPERPDPTRLTPDWSLQPSNQVTPTLKK